MSFELWLGVLGLLAGVLAFPFGYYIRGLGEKDARLFWEVDDEALWEPEIPGSDKFILLHKGKEIERARKSVFYLWSAGPGGLRGTDISDIDPLRLAYPVGLKLLSAEVLSQVEKANGVIPTIVPEEDGSESVHLKLSYLNVGDGARVEILYEDSREMELEEDEDRGAMRWKRQVAPKLLGKVQGNKNGFVAARDAIPRSQLLWPFSDAADRFSSAALLVAIGLTGYFFIFDEGALSPGGVGFTIVTICVVLAALSRILKGAFDSLESRADKVDIRLPPEKIRHESYVRVL